MMRWKKNTGAFALLIFVVSTVGTLGSGATKAPRANSTRPGGRLTQEAQTQSPAEGPHRIRVGGSIAAASLTHQVMPVYPALARQAHISGTVVLHCIIGKDGSVQQLEFVSGPPLLMKSAMDAVRQWVYKPTLLNGKAVEVDTTVSVIFTLGGDTTDSTTDHGEPPARPSAPVGSELETNIQQGTKAFDTSREPYVYETVRGTLRYENDGTGTLEIKARVRIQSSIGVEKLGQLIFNYNSANERLDILNVEVIKPDGKTIVTGPDSVQDLSAPVAMQAPMYSDARQKHVTVSGLAVGDILQYSSLNTTVKPLTPGQFWQSWKFINDAPCLDEQVELNVPSNRKIKIKSPPDVTPTNRIVGDRKIYTWKTTTEHASETPVPPLVNAKRFDAESLLIGAQPAPSRLISLSSFDSWRDVGNWYSGLERDRREPTASLKAQADEITKDAKTDLARVQALYEYVTRSIRYVSLSFGMGRYQPHSAEEVLTNRYGDCKDKATLLDALLEAEGIQSATALINSVKAIDPDVPTPSQFDHAITFVSVGGKDIWLDSTAQVAPFEYLLPQLRGKQALVVFPRQPAELKKTPERLQFAKYYLLEVTGGITEKKLSMQLAFETRGDAEVLVRAAMVSMPPSKFAQYISLGAKQADPKSDLEIADFKAGDPFDTTKPYRVELHLTTTVPDKASTSKTSSTPTFSAMDVQEILSTVLPDAPSPKASLPLSGPEQFVLKIRFDLPDKTPVTTFQPAHIVNDFAEFSANGSMNVRTLSADLDLNIRAAEIPADQIAQYTKFRTQVLEGLQRLMHVVKAGEGSGAENSIGSTTGASSPTDEEEARQLYASGLKALKTGNYHGAVELLETSTARDPHNSSVFNDLGRAYMNLRQYPQAVTSFRKAIDINPEQPYAYNNLGLVLMYQHKYDEAVPQFQKQLQVNEDDPYVHPNLGRLYMQTKEYDKAVAEFELAAKAKPDNAQAAINLGFAYAEARQIEKAEKAFDRALEISPVPSIQNDVAYELGEMNIQMDRAEALVKSAIHTVSEQTIAIDLDNLSMTDKGHMCEIAAYWDTLGWIKFHEGDERQAERFVGAAWGLCEYTAIGDHLGQIYEKQGRKADAILQYELTLGKLQAPPETRPRLTALLAPGADVDAKIGAAKDKRSAEAGIKFKNSGNANGNGEVWLVLKQGPTVDAVKFVSSSDGLQAAAADIRAVKFPNTFPDSTEIKLLRRAWVTCSTHTHECLIGLISADSVAAAN
jgi:TonB family protein